MNIKRRIQEECLVAFIHSRMIGLGKSENIDTQKAFEDEKSSEKARYVGEKYSKILEKISTFDKIQKKLEINRSYHISEVYYVSYKELEKIFDKHCPRGTEIIEGLVAINILAIYLEYWDKPRIKTDFEKLESAIVLYESVTDRSVYERMAKIATKVYKDYARVAGQKYE